MCQLTVKVVPLFTVLLDLNVPTHNNGGAIAQCCVPDGCHCNNGNTEVHTQSIYIEEAKEGKECDHVSPPAPEFPCCAQSISICSATRHKSRLHSSGM